MPQTSFKSIAIRASILILAIIGVGYFVTLSQWHKYSATKETLNSVQADNQQLTSGLSSLQKFLDSYTSQQKNTTTLLNSALPVGGTDVSNLSVVIGDDAKASGIVLSSFSIDEGSSSDKKVVLENTIQPVRISLTAQGSYASFKDFILRLEQSLRL